MTQSAEPGGSPSRRTERKIIKQKGFCRRGLSLLSQSNIRFHLENQVPSHENEKAKFQFASGSRSRLRHQIHSARRPGGFYFKHKAKSPAANSYAFEIFFIFFPIFFSKSPKEARRHGHMPTTASWSYVRKRAFASLES